MLGGSISEIAWHKAGIFKPGTSAFTVPQLAPAMEVLEKRANDAECELTTIPVRPGIADGKIKLGLAGEFQKSNASLGCSDSRETPHKTWRCWHSRSHRKPWVDDAQFPLGLV